jgi:hypothetical protein
MKKNLCTLVLCASAGFASFAHAQTQPAFLSQTDDKVGQQLSALATLTESMLKQNAYFESSQIVRRFFLCIPEASNRKFVPGVLEQVSRCFDETVDDNIEINIGGNLSRGRPAALAIATQGLASIRQNAAFSPAQAYISQYQRGLIPGTGTITLNFNVIVYQELTTMSREPLPFDPTPGPQLFVSNNTLGLRAIAPGKWRITLLKVNPLFTELSPSIMFNNPFPSFPIDAPTVMRPR